MDKIRAALMSVVITAALFLGVKCDAFGATVINDPERTYKLDTDINYRMVDPLVDFIVSSNKASSTKPIFIILDSPGGSVLAGAKILDYIRASKAPIHCVVDNFAASMAAMILENCDKRYASPSSVIMFHNASGTFKGEFPQIASRFSAFKKLVTDMEVSVATRIGMSLPDYQERIAPEWWITGVKDALKYKVVDEEAVVKMTSSQMKKKRSVLDLFNFKLGTPTDGKTIRPFDLNPFIDSLQLLRMGNNAEKEKGVSTK
jgi:ATP-dependent protease ClpP protease subunit